MEPAEVAADAAEFGVVVDAAERLRDGDDQQRKLDRMGRVNEETSRPSPVFPATNRITGTGWGYDGSGNVNATPEPRAFQYDVENRLKRQTSLSGRTHPLQFRPDTSFTG
jgi:hypothetical protein